MDGGVSLRDVYDAVNQLESKLERRLNENQSLARSLESRVRNLESFQNRTLGIIGMVSIFFSVIASYIWNKIVGG